MSELPVISAVRPTRAIEGGRIVIAGSGLTAGDRLPHVSIGDRPARIVYGSPTAIAVIVPSGLGVAGIVQVRLELEGESTVTADLNVAAPFAGGLHQVDSPVFDRDGNLFVTYSGSRGQQVPVSIFRVRPDGTREAFSSEIVNPTSMAVDPAGRLFVSSRFAATVYELHPDGTLEPFATDLGVACGLTFAPDGSLFVGDRSGTIFKLDRRGRPTVFATLPASVAAFHLALSPKGHLFVTGPTLSTYDCVREIDPSGKVKVWNARFGRPQGLAFDPDGTLCVVEALAGASGLYRLFPDRDPELFLAGPGLVGVAFDSFGAVVVCSNETAYRLPSIAGPAAYA